MPDAVVILPWGCRKLTGSPVIQRFGALYQDHRGDEGDFFSWQYIAEKAEDGFVRYLLFRMLIRLIIDILEST